MKRLFGLFLVYLMGHSCSGYQKTEENLELKIRGTWKPVKLISELSLKIDTNSTLSFDNGGYISSHSSIVVDSTYTLHDDTLNRSGRFPGVINPKDLVRFKGDTLILSSLESDDPLTLFLVENN